MRRAIQHALIAGFAAGATSACAGPLYYGDPSAQGQYVPVQNNTASASQGDYGGTASDPSSGAWAPELRGAAERAQGGGAWSAAGRGDGGSGSRVIAPGSSGVGTPSAPRYGDAGPVRNDPFGATTTLDAPARQLEPGGSGRPLMLQQYQAVLEERDALRIEVDALAHQLQLFQMRITELQEELQGGDVRNTGLEHELESLRRDLAEVEAENADLAARLTTAQIRRLEAEKDLIQVLMDNRLGVRSQVELPDSAGLPGMSGNPTGATAATPRPSAGAQASDGRSSSAPATQPANAWSGGGR